MRFRATINFESGSALDARQLVEAWSVSEGLTVYVEALPDPTDNFTVIEGEAQAGIVPGEPAPTSGDAAPIGPAPTDAGPAPTGPPPGDPTAPTG